MFQEDSPRGGIAIACPSKSSVWETASLLQGLQSTSSKTTVTTASGIIVQQQAPDTDGEGDADDENDDNRSVLRTAMLLPFDVELWRTAWLLMGEDQLFL